MKHSAVRDMIRIAEYDVEEFVDATEAVFAPHELEQDEALREASHKAAATAAADLGHLAKALEEILAEAEVEHADMVCAVRGRMAWKRRAERAEETVKAMLYLLAAREDAEEAIHQGLHLFLTDALPRKAVKP